jgi:hypothetical protein
MRALLLAPLLAFACTKPEPPPPPPPAPVPEPVKVEPAPEPAVADCVDLTFTDGNQGTYTVAEGESHVKHHFAVPEGKDALVLTVTWPDPAWTFEVTAGVGECPHAGTTHAKSEGKGSARLFLPATQLGPETKTFTPAEVWFLHLGAKGEPAPAVGATQAYTMAGQACKIVVPPAPEDPLAGRPAPAGPAHDPVLKERPMSIKERKAEGKGKKAH